MTEVPTLTQEQLLERESELAEIARALETASSGEGSLTVIEAAAGLGKTRLLEAALEGAGERGLTALRARGSELERDFAFGVVRQLLEPHLAALGEEQREEIFSGAAALARPLLADVADSVSPPPDPGYAILHGLYWLLLNLAVKAPAAARARRCSVGRQRLASLSCLPFTASRGAPADRGICPGPTR